MVAPMLNHRLREKRCRVVSIVDSSIIFDSI